MENIDTKKKKISPIKIIFFSLMLIIIVLLFFYFKNIIFEILKLTRENDKDGIKELMESQGWFGYLTIIVVEALQMIVVAIPAEFIQLPAGISFKLWVAIILCDIGVIIGASIIYFLVNILKVKPEYIKRKEQKIKLIEKKSSSSKIQALMYFLFMAPIVPFGAICYYASSKNIKYGKYIFTCATGVLPSIVTSIFIGTGVKYFFSENISIWLLVLIVIAVILILLLLAALIAKKIIFKSSQKNSPNNFLYWPIINLFGVVCKMHSIKKYSYDDLYYEMMDINSPILFLCNHQSYQDIYHVAKFIDPIRASLVGNAYYLRPKASRFAMNSLGFIPKKMFTPEIAPIKSMIKYVKNNTSILMNPEARLCESGVTNPITHGTETLIKKLNIPVVCLNIRGGYLSWNKFHKIKGAIPINIRISKIIYPEEFKEMDNETLYDTVQKALTVNDFEYANKVNFINHNLAKGYEKLIYKCPKCHNDYTISSKGNSLICECGFKLEISKKYHFQKNEFNFDTLRDAYQYIKKTEYEKYFVNNPSDIIYTEKVKVTKLHQSNKKLDVFGSGTVTLTKEGFNFDGIINNEPLKFFISTSTLECLAFGVNTEYECYYEGELYYFYPENPLSCTKVSLLYDLIVKENNKNKNQIRN